MNWLESIRAAKGYSQKAVAEEAGISQPTYCNIENGNRGVSVEVAKKIARILDFDWTKFFEDSDESA